MATNKPAKKHRWFSHGENCDPPTTACTSLRYVHTCGSCWLVKLFTKNCVSTMYGTLVSFVIYGMCVVSALLSAKSGCGYMYVAGQLIYKRLENLHSYNYVQLVSVSSDDWHLYIHTCSSACTCSLFIFSNITAPRALPVHLCVCVCVCVCMCV